MAAYLYFYNPLRLLTALVRPKTKIPLADAETWPPGMERQIGPRWKRLRGCIRRKLRAHLADAAVQVFGMWGLAHTVSRTLGWYWHLMRGNIKRHTKVPSSLIPMRSVDGGPASHAVLGTPTPECRQIRSKVKALTSERAA
jgi:hypothetical protein